MVYIITTVAVQNVQVGAQSATQHGGQNCLHLTHCQLGADQRRARKPTGNFEASSSQNSEFMLKGKTAHSASVLKEIPVD